MANKYSELRENAPFVSPYNLNLIKEAYQYKQGQVDQNRMAAYDAISNFAGIDVIKEADKEYLVNKVGSLINEVNTQFANQDLSNPSVGRSIDLTVRNSIDDKILNAAAGTREVRKLQDSIEKIRLDKPELYSPINAADAMAPVEAWMNEPAGTRLGQLSYTPYVDVVGNVDKRVAAFKKQNKGRKVQVVDPNNPDVMLDINVDQMTTDQIKQYVNSSLTDNEKQQLAINGRYLARHNPDLMNEDAVLSLTSQYVQNENNKISDLRVYYNNNEKTMSDFEKNSILQELSSAINNRDNLSSQIQSFTGQNYNPYMAGQFIVQQNMLNGIANAYAYNNTSVTQKKNDIYYARTAEDRAIRKEGRDDRRLYLEDLKTQSTLQTQALQRDVQQARLERIEQDNEYFRQYGYYPGRTRTGGTGTGTGNAANPNNAGVSTPGIQSELSETNLLSDFAGNYGENNRQLRSLYGQLGQDVKGTLSDEGYNDLLTAVSISLNDRGIRNLAAEVTDEDVGEYISLMGGYGSQYIISDNANEDDNDAFNRLDVIRQIGAKKQAISQDDSLVVGYRDGINQIINSTTDDGSLLIEQQYRRNPGALVYLPNGESKTYANFSFNNNYSEAEQGRILQNSVLAENISSSMLNRGENNQILIDPTKNAELIPALDVIAKNLGLNEFTFSDIVTADGELRTTHPIGRLLAASYNSSSPVQDILNPNFSSGVTELQSSFRAYPGQSTQFSVTSGSYQPDPNSQEFKDYVRQLTSEGDFYQDTRITRDRTISNLFNNNRRAFTSAIQEKFQTPVFRSSTYSKNNTGDKANYAQLSSIYTAFGGEVPKNNINFSFGPSLDADGQLKYYVWPTENPNGRVQVDNESLQSAGLYSSSNIPLTSTDYKRSVPTMGYRSDDNTGAYGEFLTQRLGVVNAPYLTKETASSYFDALIRTNISTQNPTFQNISDPDRQYYFNTYSTILNSILDNAHDVGAKIEHTTRSGRPVFKIQMISPSGRVIGTSYQDDVAGTADNINDLASVAPQALLTAHLTNILREDLTRQNPTDQGKLYKFARDIGIQIGVDEQGNIVTQYNN